MRGILSRNLKDLWFFILLLWMFGNLNIMYSTEKNIQTNRQVWLLWMYCKWFLNLALFLFSLKRPCFNPHNPEISWNWNPNWARWKICNDAKMTKLKTFTIIKQNQHKRGLKQILLKIINICANTYNWVQSPFSWQIIPSFYN